MYNDDMVKQVLREDMLYFYDQHLSYGGVATLSAIAAGVIYAVAALGSDVDWQGSWILPAISVASVLALCTGTISMRAYFEQNRVQRRLDRWIREGV